MPSTRREHSGGVLALTQNYRSRPEVLGAVNHLFSAEFGEGSEEKRPTVQVGDPFTEKLLLEASLELIRSGHIVGIQDMGAAGLASSSTEMAARSGTGIAARVAWTLS